MVKESKEAQEELVSSSLSGAVLVTLVRLIIAASAASFRTCHSLPLQTYHNKLTFEFTVSVSRSTEL